MLITYTTDEGSERIYLTRFSSVCCYIEPEADDARTLRLRVEPGFSAYGPEFERNRDAVAAAALNEVAARLGIGPDEVLQQPFARLKSIADPELPPQYRYARRSKNLARSYR